MIDIFKPYYFRSTIAFSQFRLFFSSYEKVIDVSNLDVSKKSLDVFNCTKKINFLKIPSVNRK